MAGGWGVGADMFGWVYGLQNMLYAVYDQPDLIQQMLELFARWNRSRMEVVLAAGVDLYIKRAWYENCDFWSPTKFQQFLAPILKSEADLAHQHGARFGYLITANCMPLLDQIAECGVDVIIGVDPLAYQPGTIQENPGRTGKPVGRRKRALDCRTRQSSRSAPGSPASDAAAVARRRVYPFTGR